MDLPQQGGKPLDSVLLWVTTFILFTYCLFVYLKVGSTRTVGLELLILRSKVTCPSRSVDRGTLDLSLTTFTFY